MSDTARVQTGQEPSIIEALRTVSMLVRVRCRAPGEMRVDRQTTREVERGKEAAEGTGSYEIKRFKAAKEWDGAIRKHQREAVKVVKHRTIPWGDDENRCLPTENFMDLVTDFDVHRKEVER